MNKDKQHKIKRFLNDTSMNEAVYSVLLESFIKNIDTNSVEEKASCWLAIQRLNDGWRELGKYDTEDEERGQLAEQPGL